MNADSIVIEETAVSQVKTFDINAVATASGLLADGRLLGESIEEFFASTAAEGAPTLNPDSFDSYFLTPTTTMLVRQRARSWQMRAGARAREFVTEDPIDRVINERVQLLARKYVAKGDVSAAERARLAIVTERVRQLLPAVTSAEYEALERHLEALQRISALNNQAREKLGKLRKE